MSFVKATAGVSDTADCELRYWNITSGGSEHIFMASCFINAKCMRAESATNRTAELKIA